MEIYNTKRCPYCKEEIMADAVKCKYCGEFIDAVPAADSRRPVVPQNYLVWAILATAFCCPPLGVVSIVFAAQVDSAYTRGEYEEAERYSRRAKSWMLASIFTAIIGLILYVLLIVFGIAAGAELNELFT